MTTWWLPICLLAVANVVFAQQITIYHLTDVHGWIFGHPHNQTLNADFGDLTSLIQHVSASEEQAGNAFFLFDTGDLIEGTGLSDATPIHGEYIFPVIQKVKRYNALTMGNHDIEYDDTIDLMRTTFIPFWDGHYLTANSLYKKTMKQLGAPYTVLDDPTTGLRLLVLGYLFNFTQNSDNTVVVPVSESLLQEYFKDAMQVDNVDMIVVLNHIGPFSIEMHQIYTAIRSFHPQLPLILLSGHTHQRNFAWFDENCFTIESGCYFKEIGVITFGLKGNQFTNFEHKWVDTSRENFYELSGTTESTFLTPEGQDVKDLIALYYNKLGLNTTYGCSPMTYSPYVPINATNSLYRVYVNQVMPETVFLNQSGTEMYMCNSATLRDYLYQGRVTKNDLLSLNPFADIYYYFGDVLGADLLTLIDILHSIPKESLLPNYKLDVTQLSLHASLPNFFHTQLSILPHQYYDLVCSKYDSVRIQKELSAKFPGKYVAQKYPTNMTSTTALVKFLETEWPCPNLMY